MQVFLTTLDLLDAALLSIGACKEARHNHVVAALEPTVATLLKKQGDGQARLRDGAMNGLVAVARCRTAGPVFVRCAFLRVCRLVRAYKAGDVHDTSSDAPLCNGEQCGNMDENRKGTIQELPWVFLLEGGVALRDARL